MPIGIDEPKNKNNARKNVIEYNQNSHPNFLTKKSNNFTINNPNKKIKINIRGKTFRNL